MKNMTLKNITAACHGTFHGDSSFLVKEITGVAIDSRKAAPGFLFVPLKGARVDGHTFIPQAFSLVPLRLWKVCRHLRLR